MNIFKRISAHVDLRFFLPGMAFLALLGYGFSRLFHMPFWLGFIAVVIGWAINAIIIHYEDPYAD